MFAAASSVLRYAARKSSRQAPSNSCRRQSAPAVPAARNGGREDLRDPPCLGVGDRPTEIVAEDNLHPLVHTHADRLESIRECRNEGVRIADISSHLVAALYTRRLRTERVGEQFELVGVRLDEADERI